MEVSVSAKTCGQTLGSARVRALAAINTQSGLSSMADLLTSAHLSVRTSQTSYDAAGLFPERSN